MSYPVGMQITLLHVVYVGYLPFGNSECYDSNGKAKLCLPPFQNVAYNVSLQATNTCGVGRRTRYCLPTTVGQKQCSLCDENVPEFKHPPDFMTDFHDGGNITWWQSETMLEGIQYPNLVNLTMDLGKLKSTV